MLCIITGTRNTKIKYNNTKWNNIKDTMPHFKREE